MPDGHFNAVLKTWRGRTLRLFRRLRHFEQLGVQFFTSRSGGRHDKEHKDLEKWNPNASHAWFAGWAPADDPELAIIVLVEHGGSGGTNAWPIAQRILEGYYTKIRGRGPADDSKVTK